MCEETEVDIAVSTTARESQGAGNYFSTVIGDSNKQQCHYGQGQALCNGGDPRKKSPASLIAKTTTIIKTIPISATETTNIPPCKDYNTLPGILFWSFGKIWFLAESISDSIEPLSARLLSGMVGVVQLLESWKCPSFITGNGNALETDSTTLVYIGEHEGSSGVPHHFLVLPRASFSLLSMDLLTSSRISVPM